MSTHTHFSLLAYWYSRFVLLTKWQLVIQIVRKVVDVTQSSIQQKLTLTSAEHQVLSFLSDTTPALIICKHKDVSALNWFSDIPDRITEQNYVGHMRIVTS